MNAESTRAPRRDTLYSQKKSRVSPFAFDARVARVFPDMLRRSIPGYEAILEMIGELAASYHIRDTRCYDLGCSLGAAAREMRRSLEGRGARIIAVDSSKAMIAACRAQARRDRWLKDVEFVLADVRDVRVAEASVAVMNFTLQFVDVADRDDIVRGVHRGLLPGGVLLLSEKISFEDPMEKVFHARAHRRFKQLRGYSSLEIEQKRQAIENVLVPETLQAHIDRLRRAGFETVYQWYQHTNFVSLAAFK